MENLSSTFAEAGMLMLVGMGFVFAFLSLLIIAIHFLAKFSSRFPDPVSSPKQSRKLAQAISSNEISPNLVAAISGAIAHYRNKNSKV
jgi:oxaloacetate decarboxylase gamma subunit